MEEINKPNEKKNIMELILKYWQIIAVIFMGLYITISEYEKIEKNIKDDDLQGQEIQQIKKDIQQIKQEYIIIKKDIEIIKVIDSEMSKTLKSIE